MLEGARSGVLDSPFTGLGIWPDRVRGVGVTQGEGVGGAEVEERGGRGGVGKGSLKGRE